MKQIIIWWLGSILLLLSNLLHANGHLLSADDAFRLKVESLSSQSAQLSWQIEEGYYLYQHQVSVQQGHELIALTLPTAQDLYDENYGHTKVYFQQLQFQIPTQAIQTYKISWQGCAKDKICYPPQHIEVTTDLNGLITLQQQQTRPRLSDLVQKNNVSDWTTEPDRKHVDGATDQIWSERLTEHSLLYGLVLFFGLGILLAFTPCSLPMLPILTALLVREHKGLKAWMIALVFVVSMASVYAVLGLVASVAGLNFQRWLQQPFTLMLFSSLFVLFALNLFGLFELRLPRIVLQGLDRAQSVQQGGTLLSASIMGMLSALLVGPCMTAPLAGALLFIAQTQNQIQGAVLLFVLGFGMGTPVLLASVLGTKVFPKLGIWMNQVKVIFGFLMLVLALYFIRPLLSEIWMQGLSLALGLSFIIYIATRLKQKFSYLYIVILLLALPLLTYQQYQQSQRFFVQQTEQITTWHIAKTAVEFQQLLTAAPPNQHIILDVYADWCVACQPIEHKILKSAKVQQALAPFYLIKLDLSDYDQSHQTLLNQWEILGPPSYLFLDPQHKEQRHLRLTGAFTEAQLLTQLALLK